MGRAKKPGLTRRVERHYRAILAYKAEAWLGNQRWAFGDRHHAWSAYFFAKKWRGRNIDIRALQRIVFHCGYPDVALRFAKDIPGVNIKKLQSVVLERGSPEEKRLFARDVPGADVQWLESMAAVQEVMEM